MTISPKRCRKCVKNLALEWNQKYQYYIPHASRSLLCIRFVAVAFQSEEEVRWRRGPPVTYFCPALDPPLDGSGRKTTTLVRDHEHFIPTKFCIIRYGGIKIEYPNENFFILLSSHTVLGKRFLQIGHYFFNNFSTLMYKDLHGPISKLQCNGTVAHGPCLC